MTAAARFEGWEVRLEGTVVNRSVEGEGVVDVSLTEKCGYDNFFKSRKKYKTLENITKKVEFKLDHRIKLRTAEQEYQFDLEQGKTQHFYVGVGVLSQPLSLVL